MTDNDNDRLRAITLMQLALELLDNAEEHMAAAHLQYAISIAQREGPEREGPGISPDTKAS